MQMILIFILSTYCVVLKLSLSEQHHRCITVLKCKGGGDAKDIYIQLVELNSHIFRNEKLQTSDGNQPNVALVNTYRYLYIYIYNSSGHNCIIHVLTQRYYLILLGNVTIFTTLYVSTVQQSKKYLICWLCWPCCYGNTGDLWPKLTFYHLHVH